MTHLPPEPATHAHLPAIETLRRRGVLRILILTLLLNVLVLIIKALLGWWTGSLSLMADALHSVTDSASNILGITTNRLADPRPDREHPYGHHKFEAIGALGIAAFLGMACFEILKSALDRLLGSGEPVQMSTPVLWLMLLVLGTNIFVAFYERQQGRRLNSNILLADAHHTMGDVWITIVVIAGLLGVQAGLPWLDLVLALPVALLVFRSGWAVLKENLPWLVDEMAIAPEEIHRVVTAVPGVIDCHDIASRGLLGRQVFVEMHLIVEAEDVTAAHDITETVEATLAERYAPIRITIHVEPRSYRSDHISYP